MNPRVLVHAAVALIALPFFVSAAEFRLGDVSIEDPWARPPPPVAVTGAAYFTLSVAEGASDRLIAVASPVAERVEMHEHSMRDGVMSMRPVPHVAVGSANPAVFKPGGLHVMLIGLREPLREGTTFPLTLTFEKAGSVTIAVSVREPAGN